MSNVSAQNTARLEVHSLPVRLIRFMSVPLLNAVPAKWLRLLMKKTSRDAATVVEHGGSTTALEAMYTRHHRSRFSRGIFQGIADFFWHHAISQPKALRNRLHIVETLIKEEIAERSGRGNTPLRILNVAGGSSRAIVHVLSARKREREAADPIQVTTVDRDDRALNLGKRIAQEYGVSESFRWIKGNVRELSALINNESFDMIEMVGLLDYFSNEAAGPLFALLRKHLCVRGSLIVANVIPNEEMVFVSKTGWPRMYYRTAEELKQLVTQTGFRIRDTIVEPLNVHAVIRASND